MHISLRISHVALATAIATLGSAALANGASPHWNYEKGEVGPNEWGSLDPIFEACSQGSYQSPIDIRNPVKADLPALEFHYQESEPTIIHNGHTIQVTVPAGQTLQIGDQRYELLQFNFHAPSEEAFNGKRADMVAHFVHKNAAGQLGVVAVLLQAGPTNADYAPIFSHLPRPGEKVNVEGLQLHLDKLLPRERTYYRYSGSLTTPPCTEGVEWMVMRQTVKIGAKQIKAFRELFKANARPIQALNDREVQVSD